MTEYIEKRMGFHWETLNPFLFCVHHNDHYPPGNSFGGPSHSLEGRNLGNDFTLKEGWRMYHGIRVPGFPAHPHRGFETITIVLNGLIDHSDSFGASGRYGAGDVQWMTAGKGIQHSEMFPLINQQKENHLELFQIWLNLPAKNKFAPPHYSMFWREDIPSIKIRDKNNKKTEIMLIAGNTGQVKALAPPPYSWAADPENQVWIFIIKMKEGASYTIDAPETNTSRMLYYYEGNGLRINDREIPSYHSLEFSDNCKIRIQNGGTAASLLFLQSKPINEEIVSYGPFVMNTRNEIEQAFRDYHATKFGGWPWKATDHIHPLNAGRFAHYINGEKEYK